MAQHFIDFENNDGDNQSVAESYIGSEQARFNENHNLEEIFVPNDKSDKIVVSITDTGVGISDSQRVKLFKLFGCIQNVEHESNQGIGLGLVIAEKIVKAFDGMIGMRSKKNVGSQFSFSILLKDQNKIMDPKKDKTGQMVDSLANINSMMDMEMNYPKIDIESYLNKVKFVRETHQTGKILVVDDEQYNLDILEAFFKILKVDNMSEIVTFCRDGE